MACLGLRMPPIKQNCINFVMNRLEVRLTEYDEVYVVRLHYRVRIKSHDLEI